MIVYGKQRVRQKTAREMLVERDGAAKHNVVELVGGPLDGKRFHEAGPGRFSHDSRDRYVFEGNEYRPNAVVAGVLYMKWSGRYGKAYEGHAES